MKYFFKQYKKAFIMGLISFFKDVNEVAGDYTSIPISTIQEWNTKLTEKIPEEDNITMVEVKKILEKNGFEVKEDEYGNLKLRKKYPTGEAKNYPPVVEVTNNTKEQNAKLKEEVSAEKTLNKIDLSSLSSEEKEFYNKIIKEKYFPLLNSILNIVFDKFDSIDFTETEQSKIQNLLKKGNFNEIYKILKNKSSNDDDYKADEMIELQKLANELIENKEELEKIDSIFFKIQNKNESVWKNFGRNGTNENGTNNPVTSNTNSGNNQRNVGFFEEGSSISNKAEFLWNNFNKENKVAAGVGTLAGFIAGWNFGESFLKKIFWGVIFGGFGTTLGGFVGKKIDWDRNKDFMENLDNIGKNLDMNNPFREDNVDYMSNMSINPENPIYKFVENINIPEGSEFKKEQLKKVSIALYKNQKIKETKISDLKEKQDSNWNGISELFEGEAGQKFYKQNEKYIKFIFSEVIKKAGNNTDKTFGEIIFQKEENSVVGVGTSTVTSSTTQETTPTPTSTGKPETANIIETESSIIENITAIKEKGLFMIPGRKGETIIINPALERQLLEGEAKIKYSALADVLQIWIKNAAIVANDTFFDSTGSSINKSIEKISKKFNEVDNKVFESKNSYNQFIKEIFKEIIRVEDDEKDIIDEEDMQEVYKKLQNIDSKNYNKTILSIYDDMRVGFIAGDDGDSKVINELLGDKILQEKGFENIKNIYIDLEKLSSKGIIKSSAGVEDILNKYKDKIDPELIEELRRRLIDAINQIDKESKANKQVIEESYSQYLKLNGLNQEQLSLKDYKIAIHNGAFLNAAKKSILYTKIDSLKERGDETSLVGMYADINGLGEKKTLLNDVASISDENIDFAAEISFMIATSLIPGGAGYIRGSKIAGRLISAGAEAGKIKKTAAFTANFLGRNTLGYVGSEAYQSAKDGEWHGTMKGLGEFALLDGLFSVFGKNLKKFNSLEFKGHKLEKGGLLVGMFSGAEVIVNVPRLMNGKEWESDFTKWEKEDIATIAMMLAMHKSPKIIDNKATKYVFSKLKDGNINLKIIKSKVVEKLGAMELPSQKLKINREITHQAEIGKTKVFIDKEGFVYKESNGKYEAYEKDGVLLRKENIEGNFEPISGEKIKLTKKELERQTEKMYQLEETYKIHKEYKEKSVKIKDQRKELGELLVEKNGIEKQLLKIENKIKKLEGKSNFSADEKKMLNYFKDANKQIKKIEKDIELLRKKINIDGYKKAKKDFKDKGMTKEEIKKAKDIKSASEQVKIDSMMMKLNGKKVVLNSGEYGIKIGKEEIKVTKEGGKELNNAELKKFQEELYKEADKKLKNFLENPTFVEKFIKGPSFKKLEKKYINELLTESEKAEVIKKMGAKEAAKVFSSKVGDMMRPGFISSGIVPSFKNIKNFGKAEFSFSKEGIINNRVVSGIGQAFLFNYLDPEKYDMVGFSGASFVGYLFSAKIGFIPTALIQLGAVNYFDGNTKDLLDIGNDKLNEVF